MIAAEILNYVGLSVKAAAFFSPSEIWPRPIRSVFLFVSFVFSWFKRIIPVDPAANFAGQTHQHRIKHSVASGPAELFRA